MASSFLSKLSMYRREALLAFTFLIAISGIAGWTLDISALKGEFHNLVPIAQSGAICMAIFSASLAIYLHIRLTIARMISHCLLFLVLVFSGLVLARFIFHFSFDPEGIFEITSWTNNAIPKGRMSSITALMFIVLILTFFTHVLPLNTAIQKINKIITIVTCIFSFLLITGYFYNTPLLYTEKFIPVSFPAALAFFFISLTLLDIYDLTLFSDKFKQQSFIAYRLSKAFLPVVLILVITHGFIHANIIYSSANPAVAATILLVVAIIITILIISNVAKHIGKSIEQAEHEKNNYQTELAKSNERFSLIFYNSHEAIGVSRKGIHLYANPAYLDLFGYTKEELKDKPVVDLIADQEKDRILHYISERAKGYNVLTNYETIGKRKDGSEFDFEITISLFPNGDEPNTLVTVRNITERKITERTIHQNQLDLANQNEEYVTLFEEYKTINEELSERNNELIEFNKKLSISEEQYRSLFDNMLNGFALCRMIFDQEKRPVDFIYLKVNKAFGSLTGLKDVVGKPVTEVIPGIRETDTKLLETYGRVAVTGNPEYLEIFLESLNMWFSISIFSPEPEYFVAVFDVITERKLMEESLRESRKQLLDIIDNTPALVYACDREGRYTLANQSLAKLFGTTRENMIGKTRMDFLPLEIAEEHHQNELKVIEKKEAIFFEETNNQADGTHYYFTVKFPLFNPSNQIYSVCGISLDITERKLIQDQLLVAKEKAEESDRLKTAFLQNMSHEIRTPMNAIMGFSQLLPENFNNKPKLELFSNVINQRCLDLLEIINEILDISKIESGQLTLHQEQCSIKDMFNELNEMFISYRQRIKKQELDFIIASHCDPEQDIIITDGVKLRQILINLINNAFKFTYKGKIDVGCRLDTNKKLTFYVSDTGIGIPADKQDLIFNRFSQLNESNMANTGGTGLGLAIVKGLVRVLGGEIWLTSEVGKGTTFYFSFPYQVAMFETPKKTDSQEINQFYFPNKKVLIVEDEYFNAEYIKEIFEDTGFQILYTEYGIEAVEIIKHQSIDIVLLDIRLPDIEGYQVAQMIKKWNPTIKIIAQTAYATQADREKALKSGCDDYISKPFNRELLFIQINKLFVKA